MPVTDGSETLPNSSEADARLAAANYIADLTANLALIARNHGLETLSYVLEMARLEAQATVHKSEPH